MSKKVKIIGYSTKVVGNNNDIEYRNFSDNLVGQQTTSSTSGGLPYTITNIYDTEFSTKTRHVKNYITNNFSNFVTLTDIDLDNINFNVLSKNGKNLELNYDVSDLSRHSCFGSLKEYFRVTIEQIILNWPASIYVDSVTSLGETLLTVEDYVYDNIDNTSTFKINVNTFNNPFLVGYTILDETNIENTRNLTILYKNGKPTEYYNINYENQDYPIVEFTPADAHVNSYVIIKVGGNPFSSLTGTTGSLNYHIKPNELTIEKFFNSLDDLGYYMLNRFSVPKYKFHFKVKLLSNDGRIVNTTKTFIWPVSDGYNIDFSSPSYEIFIGELLSLIEKSDKSRTNIMVRELVDPCIVEFDTLAQTDGGILESESQKMVKTLQIYGRGFDEIKKYIDNIAYTNTVTYDKKNNTSDELVRGLANTLGWEITDTVLNSETLSYFIGNDNPSFSGLSREMSVYEKENEFWRRMVLNTPWLWRSKGTRKSVEFLLKMFGTPRGLVNFNEYVYVVDRPVDMGRLRRLAEYFDLDINKIPVDVDGYPKPLPSNDENYFQMDGQWYRETGGYNATIDKLSSNNPHIGPYDGGRDYLRQFECLIPNFEPTSLMEENIVFETTQHMTNYNGGTFDDIVGSAAVATMNISVGSNDVNLALNACGATDPESFNIKYGLLYNWYAVADSREITSSDDWSVPTSYFSGTDFSVLKDYLTSILGSYTATHEGGILKETGTTYWNSPNTGATNELNFNGRGSGRRQHIFSNIEIRGDFWSLTTIVGGFLFARLTYNSNDLNINIGEQFGGIGKAVRLLRPATTEEQLLDDGTVIANAYTGNNGFVYDAVKIGTQVWINSNLNETKYRNGDDIPLITDNTEWESAGINKFPASCYYDNDENNGYIGGTTTIAWSINIYINDNLSYNGSPFFTDDYNVLPTINDINTELQTAIQSLGLSFEYIGGKYRFIQASGGFGLCDPPNLTGLPIRVELCITVDSRDIQCKYCITKSEALFEEAIYDSEIFIGTYTNDNQIADNCYNITTDVIPNPHPQPKQTICGCDETLCENALRICITPISEEDETEPDNNICGEILDYTLEQNGFVLFEYNSGKSWDVKRECCENLGYNYTYNKGGWRCSWNDDIKINAIKKERR